MNPLPLPALWLLQGAVLLTATLLLSLAFRRHAARRHLVLAGGLLGLLWLPLLQPLLPSVPLVVAEQTAAAPEAPLPRSEEKPAIVEAPPALAAEPSEETAQAVAPLPFVEEATTPTSAGPTWREAVLALWLGGALVFGLRLLRSLRSAHRIARAARPAPDSLLDRLRGDNLRPCELAIAAVDTPLLFAPGFGRARLLLPPDSLGWSEERLDAVLRHELAHLRRGDGPLRLLARLAAALHWPNPLVWRALSTMDDAAELACDDSAIEGGHTPRGYARHLVDIARSARTPRLALLGMARRRGLERRIRCLLDPRRGRGEVRRQRTLLRVVPLLGAALLAPLVPSAQERSVKGPVSGRDAGLAWLAAQQDPKTGAWVASVGRKFNTSYSKSLEHAHHVGVTATCVLAILEAGPELRRKYHRNAERGVRWILTTTKPNEWWFTHGGSLLKSHALALQALGAWLRLHPNDAELRKALQRAADFTLAIRDPEQYGWRYLPGVKDSDVHGTALMIEGLRSVRDAGLKLRGHALQQAEAYVRSCRRTKADKRTQDLIAYQTIGWSRATVASTAAGLSCLMDAKGADRDAIRRSLRRLAEEIPAWEKRRDCQGFLTWYPMETATRAFEKAASFGEEEKARWESFRKSCRQWILSQQRPDGSWPNPDGPGPCFATAQACRILSR